MRFAILWASLMSMIPVWMGSNELSFHSFPRIKSLQMVRMRQNYRQIVCELTRLETPLFKCVFPYSCLAHLAPPTTPPPPISLPYISSFALTSLVKIVIIFHPLIAHSIQQIGEHWLLLHASRCRGRVVLRLEFLITPRACSRSGESLYVLANDWHA